MTENVYESPQADLETGDRQVAILTRSEILFSINGRIGRQTYWLNYLAMMFVFIVVYMLLLVGLGIDPESDDSALFTIITFVMYVPAIWIGVALSVKRWHDRNKSGWWVLIGLIPLIGPIWALVENGCLAGDVESNQYGHPPF